MPRLALLCALLCLAAAPARGSELVLVIQGLESAEGELQIELFGAAQRANFPYAERGVLAELRIPARMLLAPGASVSLGELPPGTYAIAVIHDANGNGDMDFDLLGLPKESYGFSNGARPRLGPPSFDAAAVRVTGDGVTRAEVTLAR
jgi:uncharacterized protein (DUF2141 family)